ncbi:MAG: hypothetical protein WD826_08540 [Actinomycetota bacterium]
MSDRYELSIEVIDAAFPASSWKYTYGDMLTTTAMEHGADDWQWIERTWGVVFEVAFKRQRDAEFWLTLPSVFAAFDAVPDPVGGLVWHRGWGGTSGRGERRKRGPRAGAGGAEVPLPDDPEGVEAVARAGERYGEIRIRTAAASI